MERLIADLLDVSRIEAGTFAVRRDPVVIAAIVSNVVEGFQERAAAAGVSLTGTIDGNLPTISGDEQRLSQALSNLIGNALKFTPAGGRIHVAARCDGADLSVAVEDSGCGIDAASLGSVFDRFWQRDRTQGGAGLGLAIVKGIVDSHDGRVEVASAPGRGTTFTIVVPGAAAR